jgi:acetyl-CoA C-acetyltransferase
MREVAIIGVGQTRFGELFDRSLRDLTVEAGIKAVGDAGINAEDIQALYGGSMTPGILTGQEHIGPFIADWSGLTTLHIPATRVEAACASGAAAFRQAYLCIKSGEADIAIAGGAEKMTDVGSAKVTGGLTSAGDILSEGSRGLPFTGEYGQITREYERIYGDTSEQRARFVEIAHRNAKYNPCAQFQREITKEQILSSNMVADPLRLLDCSSVADGAAAVILCEAEKAKKYTDTPIYIEASSQTSDWLALKDKGDLCTFEGTKIAAREAYYEAGMGTSSIDVVEQHDCFSITGLINIEDLRFAKKGKGGRLVMQGDTEINGKIPMNTTGGLKACGHPLGATGIRQIVDIVKQLKGEFRSEIQVPNAEIGLTHNIGGVGGTVIVHILGRRENV